jgi:hypothetical protein
MADRSAQSREADIHTGRSREGDEHGRGKGDLQKIGHGNIQVDSDTGNDLQRLLRGNRALVVAINLSDRHGVVEQADPDGDIGAGAELEADNVQAGVDTDVSAQTES